MCRLTPGTKDSSITLNDCLFGSVKLTKNAEIDKYKYSGYGIGFDSRETFSHPSGGDGKNFIILGADMSNSVHANNKTRTTIYAGKMYSPNFTVGNKKFIYLSIVKKFKLL